MAKRVVSGSAPSITELIAALTRRLDELEGLVSANRRILDLQFKRIADMQAEIDRLTAHLKRGTL